MIEITNVSQLTDVTKPDIYQYKNIKHSNTIYTYDIEVSSLFHYSGQWQVFDYTKPFEFWSDNVIDKRSCVYVSMFGINDNVYYFRTFSMIKDILEKLSNPKIKKYIYIFNLSYEYQFLRMVLSDYTITDMIASAPRKPISFYIKELNIEFRCAYKLTMLSLARAGEKYTDVKKASGDLYYNKARSPLTKLTPQELYYCEMDIIVLYYIIVYFRKEYKSVARIPLTQTGEIRRDIKQRVDYYYIKKQQSLVSDVKIRENEIQAFSGGLTHGNYIYTGHVLTPDKYGDYIYSSDLDSAYPSQCLNELPVDKWHLIDESEIKDYKLTHCLMYVVNLYNIESKYYNHYIPISKCIDYKKAYVDNGRVVKCGFCQMVLTDIDFEIIKQSYNIEDIEILEIYANKRGYLDKRIINYILDLWHDKSTLKGIPEQYDYYMKQKGRLNGIYGCMVTNVLKQNTLWNNSTHDWEIIHKTDEKFIIDKLNESKNSYSTLFPYSAGLYLVARNRRVLWENIIKHDIDVVYYDTDSIKSIGKIDYTDFNKKVYNEHVKMCNKLGINPDRLKAVDSFGNVHNIGFFEQEEKNTAKEFCTLGAKKYCYRTLDNKLHLTVSGVKKSSVTDLHDNIYNFKDGAIFGYNQTNDEDKHENEKLTHYYNDEQEPFNFVDIDGNTYHCTDSYGVILQPTIYSLGYTDLLELAEKEYIVKSKKC